MNWEMIGAAGVIATLTYLARQVRTSNRASVPTKSPRARMRMEPALCIIPMEL